MKASYTLSHPVLPMGGTSRVDLLVSFTAEGASDSKRRALNLSVVIDRSASMAGAPLKNALQASRELVERMSAEDRLSVVAYDDSVLTVLPPTHVKDKAAICQKINQVRAGGCTNLSGGWLKGVEYVASQQSSDHINRVLLLTDGQANAGIRDPGQLIALAREKSNAGVITTTLGFGDNFNEDLLIGMANASEGHFYYIQSPEDAVGVFGIEMEGLGSLVAQNLEVTLRPASSVKVASVLNRYRFESRGQEVVVGLGDVYATEPRQLAAELSVEAPSAAGPVTLATLVYRAQVLVNGSVQELSGEVPIVAQLAPASEVGAGDKGVLAQTSRLRIARVKDQAVELADKGELASASKRLREVITEVSAHVDKASYDIAEEMEQLAHYAQRLESRKYDAVIRKEMRDQSYQAGTRSRGDLALRGTTGGSADSLDAVSDAGTGIVLKCVREGGKLRVHTISAGYDASFNVQFPRSAREEGASYVVERLEPSGDGSFYRATGTLKRLVVPGQERVARSAGPAPAAKSKPTASKVTAGSAADLPTTQSVGTGVIVQCIKEGSKLRARVVSDGYDPDLNIRFPRDIREENVLYVVDAITTTANGGSYIACGDIRRLVQ